MGTVVRPGRRPKTVYIIGAGFSKEFDYPLTRNLLHLLPNGINDELKQIICFHYPSWDGRTETLPDIEELLTSLSANEELLPHLRAGGKFEKQSVQTARNDLLRETSKTIVKAERTSSKVSRTTRTPRYLNHFVQLGLRTR